MIRLVLKRPGTSKRGPEPRVAKPATVKCIGGNLNTQVSSKEQAQANLNGCSTLKSASTQTQIKREPRRHAPCRERRFMLLFTANVQVPGNLRVFLSLSRDRRRPSGNISHGSHMTLLIQLRSRLRSSTFNVQLCSSCSARPS